MSRSIFDSIDVSGLATYVRDEIWEQFKDNRKSLEDKWERNRSIWKGQVTSHWKTHQENSTGDDDWKSKITVDIANQKATAACSLISNMAFKKGRLPLQLESLDNFEATPEDKHQADLQLEKIQRHLQDLSMKAEAPTECRRSFLQAAIYGVSYMKMNLGSYSDNRYEVDEDGIFGEVSINRSFIGLERVSVWDIFRDLESNNLQEGRGVIHRQYLSNYDLRSMIGKSFYDEKAIEAAIATHISDYDGVEEDAVRPGKFGEIVNKNNNIEYLECWVRVPIKLVKSYIRHRDNSGIPDIDQLKDGKEINILIGLVGNHIVRFTPVEDGERPFLRQPWEEDIDELESIGVCDKLEMYQNSLTGSMREFENNKKLSGNVMMGIKRKMVKNMPESLEPGVNFDLSEECERAADAFQQVVVADVGDSLLSHIEMTMNLADQTSNMPREMTGASGSGAASVAEFNQIIARSGKYLLTVVGNWDQHILEPYFEKQYELMMADPDMQEYHGNYKVKAIGFESFEARSVKSASLMQMLTMSAQSENISGAMEIEWLLTEIAKSLDLDSQRVLKSPEKKQAEQQQQLELERQQQEQIQQSPEYQMSLAKQQADIDRVYADIEIDKMKVEAELLKLQLEKEKIAKMPEKNVGGGVEGI